MKKIVYRLQRKVFLLWQDAGDFETEKEAQEAQEPLSKEGIQSRILELWY